MPRILNHRVSRRSVGTLNAFLIQYKDKEKHDIKMLLILGIFNYLKINTMKKLLLIIFSLTLINCEKDGVGKDDTIRAMWLGEFESE